MSQLSFDHLLQLSFAFHARRKTGEVLRILDRGAAINHTFEVRTCHSGVLVGCRLNRLITDPGFQRLAHVRGHWHCSDLLHLLFRMDPRGGDLLRDGGLR